MTELVIVMVGVVVLAGMVVLAHGNALLRKQAARNRHHLQAILDHLDKRSDDLPGWVPSSETPAPASKSESSHGNSASGRDA